eukprot:5348752-Pleurochrysis_carterae.AAC.1
MQTSLGYAIGTEKPIELHAPCGRNDPLLRRVSGSSMHAHSLQHGTSRAHDRPFLCLAPKLRMHLEGDERRGDGGRVAERRVRVHRLTRRVGIGDERGQFEQLCVSADALADNACTRAFAMHCSMMRRADEQKA